MDSDPGSKFASLITQLLSAEDADDSDSYESIVISSITEIIALVSSMDMDSQPEAESELMSLVKKTIHVYNSMDLDSQPEPLKKLISLVSHKLYFNSTKSESELISLITQITSLISSVDLDSQPESELMSLTSQTISFFKSMDLDSQPTPLREFIPLISQKISHLNSIDLASEPYSELKLSSLVDETFNLEPEPELISLIRQIVILVMPESESESEPESEPEPEMESDLKSLKSLVSQLMSMNRFCRKPLSNDDDSMEPEGEFFTRLVTQLMSLFSSMDLDSQPKPESELMSLTKQAISLFNSMDTDSQQRLISLISQNLYSSYGYARRSMKLETETDLTSLIRQIFSLAISMDSEWCYLTLVCPQVKVRLEKGNIHVSEREDWRWCTNNKWHCLPLNWHIIRLAERYSDTHFICRGCDGENHKEYEKAPVEIKHLLHPKHPLQLVLYPDYEDKDNTRQCYCCDKDLEEVFYCCLDCGYAMNTACAENPPSLSIDCPKWHEHPLALFPRQTSLTCSLCALTHSNCPFYVCPPCDFVVHQSCIKLPRVIRISRHPHRLAFTFSFDQGVRSCGVCRTKIDNNNGGYSCIKDGCSYEAHSKCATQSNVWDGKELEDVREEIEEEEEEPFVRISDGIILHFRHQHQLTLDKNTDRDYNEDKQCQACFTPIYFGNIYSCMQCDYILHEKCAELSRKIHHPIHPHLLTLVGGYDDKEYTKRCSGCDELCIAEFYYKCSENGCDFQLHVPCATIFEPLNHENHMHPLFLTSKPGEMRKCSACKYLQRCATRETFNCIDEKCEFCLCFGCATLPQKVRYKHDKHVLTLCFGKEEIRTMTYWCEVCEKNIAPNERFYMCDEYCCVTLHIKCMLGEDLYMKPGSLWNYFSRIAEVLPNNHMSRPICSKCEKRCPYKTLIKKDGLIFCRQDCFRYC